MIFIAAFAVPLASFFSKPAAAQSAPGSTAPSAAALNDAKNQAGEQISAGRFADAIPHQQRALKIAEELHGAGSVEAAIEAHSLGAFERRAGRVQEAKADLERALAVYRTKLPAIHEDLRNLVGELGQIYVAEGRGAEVAELYEELIARATGEGHGTHVAVAHMLTNLGYVFSGLKRAEESEEAFQLALPIYEQQQAFTGDGYRSALEARLDRLEKTSRLKEAEELAGAAITALSRLKEPEKALAARLHNRLSKNALEDGRLAEAQSHAEAALALVEGKPSTVVRGLDEETSAWNGLARAHRAASRFEPAEAAYKRALARLEAQGDKANIGILSDNLAVLYLSFGRMDEAERMNKRALAVLEDALGREHPTVGQAAANLAAILVATGRYNEAEPLLRRALAIAEARKPQDPVGIGIVTDNLAGLLRETGRNAEARISYERALALFESALPAKHPRIATSLNNLGRFLLDTGDLDAAETVLERSAAMHEEIYGAASPDIAIPLSNLGETLARMKRYGEARPPIIRALSLLEKTYGPKHAKVEVTLTVAGELELAAGNAAGAETYFKRAVEIAHAGRARGPSDNRRPFHGLIEALWANGRRDAAQALEVGQWVTMTEAAGALAALGARAGAGNAELVALTRERQDLAAEWQAADKRLTELLAQSGQRNVAREKELRTSLERSEQRIAEIDSTLAIRFPRYHDLVRPKALSKDAVRALLAPTEAAVQVVVTPSATHVWLVSKTDLIWHRIPMTEPQLRTLVHALRCGLDETEWEGAGKKRCAKILDLDVKDAPRQGDPLPFPLTTASSLYTFIFKPLEPAISGKELLFVPSGALTTLPPGVLVRKPVAEGAPPDYANTAWLAREHAITILPSLASLTALRQQARAVKAEKPYLAFGNPLLTGPDGKDRSAWAKQACSKTPAAAAPITLAGWTLPETFASVFRGASADPVAIRRQAPLPETADELCAVAVALSAAPDSVNLGARATETRIRELDASGDLAKARVLHFATHGLIAKETESVTPGIAEPAILLTPPEQAQGPEEDGLLTASEVAELKLDADWVILSACNTAAGGEKGDAEALSGLARSFFYSGARALLVSHWYVDSMAAVKITTGAFDAMRRDPGIGRAEALRRALAAAMADTSRPSSWVAASHPAIWAPFVIVGEGGRIAP